MLQIHYFASVREAMGREREQVDLPPDVASVAELIPYLRSRDSAFARMFAEHETLLAAVNQTVAGNERAIADGDEIAFFPPMSGG